MKRPTGPIVAAAAVLAILCIAQAALAEHTVYKAQHRLAEELAAIVRPLVDEVAVDVRTNSLVLSGTPAQIRAAADLLAEQDRKLRTVRIRVTFIERERIEASRLAVRTEYAADGFWVAIASGDVTKSGFEHDVTAGARHFTSDRKTDQYVVVQEGGEATITTGRSMPVNQWVIDFAQEEGPSVEWRAQTRMDTGFVVSPRIVEGGRILLSIAPRAAFRTEHGPKEIVYRRASTSVSVAPGESVIVAGGESERGKFVSGMLAGFESEEARGEWAMALQADVVVE